MSATSPARGHGDRLVQAIGLYAGYGSLAAVRDVDLKVREARWWRCWAPTARVRRPRS